jgi:hypothetical protein
MRQHTFDKKIKISFPKGFAELNPLPKGFAVWPNFHTHTEKKSNYII